MGKLMGRRERKKIESKKSIMHAAVRNFTENGVTETSIADIMKEAGLGVGTFYNYFESKDALLFCLLQEIAETICNQAVKSMDDGEPAETILREAVKNTTEALSANPYVLPLFLGTAGKIPNVREHMNEKPVRSPGFKSVFADIIKYGQEHGEFDKTLDPDLVTEMFHSIFQAASFSSLPYTFGDNVARKVGFILKGIEPR